MPKKSTIKKVAVLGAGPITIGQACEFDYSGTQACQALKEEGCHVLLVNSNPATIMTDPSMSDSVFIEPMDSKTLSKVLRREKPDSILPTIGGQTALNCLLELKKLKILEEIGLECLGVSPSAIIQSEDREKFKALLEKMGIGYAHSQFASSLEEAQTALINLKRKSLKTFPVIIRPSFTLGGAGGGIAYCQLEFNHLCIAGLKASPVREILIEESLLGWKEYEVEVVKDHKNNCIAVCTIENIDPMGVHTGDSVTVAPAQTLTDYEIQKMRSWAFAVVKKIGVQAGCVNVQFAVCAQTGRMIVVEMNPRVSRSSALASKATGFPIARIATKLAIGYSLDELRNRITRNHVSASFEPTLDYLIVKMPRFSFEKFPGVEPILTTQMQSVGEVMGVGRTFGEALQKAIRSLDISVNRSAEHFCSGRVASFLHFPNPQRLECVMEAFRIGTDLENIFSKTCIDRWFLFHMQHMAQSANLISLRPLNNITRQEWYALKQLGFSDSGLSKLWKTAENNVTFRRRSVNVRPIFKRIDTCAAEFKVKTAYLYSTYEENCEAMPSLRDKIIVLGSGPNRIGQGLEFDYCCVHAASTIKRCGAESIMINCNPETVSTDYDISDKLYFEPVCIEDVEEISLKENPIGTIIQFGGQTPLKLSKLFAGRNIILLGTNFKTIELAESREQFKKVLDGTALRQPENCSANSRITIIGKALSISFPVILRPSFVLGGSSMKIIYSHKELLSYIEETDVTILSSILVEKFLEGAVECDADCICDGKRAAVVGIMEHVEQAGIHSGDSACSTPSYSLRSTTLSNLKAQTKELAKLLKVVGLMNIQFAVQCPGTKDESLYVLELNPRASRTIPFVSKATGVMAIRIATELMVKREKLKEWEEERSKVYAVKESVFPFAKFPHFDCLLGPEMRSTGEVMGVGRTFGEAWMKSQLATNVSVSTLDAILTSTCKSERAEIVQIIRWFSFLNFNIQSVKGSYRIARSKGLSASPRLFLNRQVILITTSDKDLKLRQRALKTGMVYYSTIRSGLAFVEGHLSLKDLRVYKIQENIGEWKERNGKRSELVS